MSAFTQEGFDKLWAHFYNKQVRLNAELPMGMILRREEKPARIDCQTPAYDELKRRIKQFKKEKDYSAIYDQLSRLKKHEDTPWVYPHPGIILDDEGDDDLRVIGTGDRREENIINADDNNVVFPAIMTSTTEPTDPSSTAAAPSADPVAASAADCGKSGRSVSGQKKAGSSFAGVTFRENRKRWIARGYLNNKRVFLGYFSEEMSAALAYDAWAQDKEGKIINFPNEDQQAAGRGGTECHAL